MPSAQNTRRNEGADIARRHDINDMEKRRWAA